MFARACCQYANHLLEPAAWARESLAAHAGKVVAIEMFPVRLAVAVNATGLLQAAPPGANADARIRLTPATALQILAQGEAAWRQADVQGDTEFAATIARIAANLPWDFEEDLSGLFGDVAAHRLALAGRAAAHWPKQAVQGIAGNVVEFLTEEKHLLVTPLRAAEFVREVDDLRDAVERLAKRVARLRRQLRAD